METCMRVLLALMCARALVLAHPSAGIHTDQGFNHLWTTNLDTFQDHEVKFASPLPAWLRGTWIQNGLGRFEMGPRHFTHAFDAFSKLASFKFQGDPQKALFSTKMLHTNIYKDSLRHGTVAPYLVLDGVSPPYSFFERMRSFLRGTDNTVVNVYDFGKPGQPDMVAVSDFWRVYRFNQSTLETIGKVEAHLQGDWFFSSFKSRLSSSHALPEHGTSNFLNFVTDINLSPGSSTSIKIVRIKSTTKREVIATILLDRIPYIHSFAVTKNYMVLFVNPAFVDVGMMLRTGSPMRSLEWLPERGTKAFVVDLRTGGVQVLHTEAVFMLHHVNAHETANGDIKVDMVTYQDISTFTGLHVDLLKDPERRNTLSSDALLKRYTLNLGNSTVHVDTFQPGLGGMAERLDLPIINEAYRYRHHCYVWGVVSKAYSPSIGSMAMVKKDLCNQGRDVAWSRPNHYMSEPWFIPNPGAEEEDDGFLLTTVLNGHNQKSYIAILDARTMTLVNHSYLPTALPFRIHGRWFPH